MLLIRGITRLLSLQSVFKENKPKITIKQSKQMTIFEKQSPKQTTIGPLCLNCSYPDFSARADNGVQQVQAVPSRPSP